MNQTLIKTPSSKGINIAAVSRTHPENSSISSTLPADTAEISDMFPREAGSSNSGRVRSDSNARRDDPEAREEVLDASIKNLWSEHATAAEHSKRGRVSYATLRAFLPLDYAKHPATK